MAPKPYKFIGFGDSLHELGGCSLFAQLLSVIACLRDLSLLPSTPLLPLLSSSAWLYFGR